MKVYIVSCDDCIDRVFDSQEKAEKYLSELGYSYEDDPLDDYWYTSDEDAAYISVEEVE